MDVVARLARLDTCAVSDARDRLGLDDRVATGIPNLTGIAPLVGRAVTVLLGPPLARTGDSEAVDSVSGNPAGLPRSEERRTTRHLCTGAIEAASTGDVIVIAHQGRTDCAGWGGNLSRAAVARRVGGTLIDGAARDIDEARELAYPVYASAATPRTARGRTREHAWNVPIEFAGISVDPGDFVIADSTGIVFVPESEVEAVLAAAEAIAAKEAAMAADIDAGVPVSQVMGADYESMLGSPPLVARLPKAVDSPNLDGPG